MNDARRAEERFALALLLGLQARGVLGIGLTDGRLERALAGLLEAMPDRVEALVGFVPMAHPLYGTYPCLDDAAYEALSAGLGHLITPRMDTLYLDVSEDTALSFVRGWPVSIAFVAPLRVTQRPARVREGGSDVAV